MFSDIYIYMLISFYTYKYKSIYKMYTLYYIINNNIPGTLHKYKQNNKQVTISHLK